MALPEVFRTGLVRFILEARSRLHCTLVDAVQALLSVTETRAKSRKPSSHFAVS